MKLQYHILMIDDDEEDYQLTLHHFKQISARHPYQYYIDWTPSITEGQALINTGNYDAYLIDYHLGEYSGIELLKKVDIKQKKAPAIMLTGEQDMMVDQQAMEMGVYDFICKGKLDDQTIDRSVRYAIQHKKALNELYEIEQQKTLFVAMLSHDLKVPLYGEQKILNHLLSQEYGDLTVMQKNFLQELKNSNQYLCHMINNLLLTYKYQDGNIVLDKKPTNLKALCQKLILGSLSTLAEEKELLIQLKVLNNLPWVFVDTIEIKRVLTNLIQNAIQHSPKNRTITLELDCQEANVLVAVKDQGKGIASDRLAELFKPFSSFQQLRSVGTGLGLYISKRIIEAHGGQICVDSKVEEGSCFSFTLPFDGVVVQTD